MTTFDLNAAVGDAASEPFRFTWGNSTFDLPHLQDRPVDEQLAIIAAIDALDIGNTSAAELLAILRLVLGDDTMTRLNAAKPVPATALMALLKAWMAYHRGELGKSEASPASSASTAAPSKPTSRSGRGRKTN